MSVPVIAAIGPYAILETLETRAFTVTYRAEQPDVGRTVLIKALKSTVSRDSPFAAALGREAAVLGRLDHEGVIRLHDFVRAGDVPHLVLEDARGVTLSDVLEAARLDVEQAVAVALAAARALGHAHERGVVHRALGSGVVAIAPRGRVLLADFSRAIAGGADDAVELGEHLSESSYLAPEQILGEPATPRSDVWSLGVLLHELCAGVRPFDGDDARLTASRIREGAPAPLPAPAPPAVARIVARCLAKDPDDRYADARAVAAALEDALAALSPLPVTVLASRALAAARLGEALPAPATLATLATAERRAAAPGPDLRRAARELAVVLALIVVGAAGIRALADAAEGTAPDGVAEPSAAGAAGRDRGHLRVVARPWAEVLIDGELVDVTPVGRPLPVAPGKHFVTFRHPNAPDEQRAVKVLAGQTVFLDVAMRVDRGDAGAPARAGTPDAGASP